MSGTRWSQPKLNLIIKEIKHNFADTKTCFRLRLIPGQTQLQW